MKKTLTANISGTVFHIEEDAYEALNRYLGNIRSRFAGTAGRDDIMADIEARIAELFQERLDALGATSTGSSNFVARAIIVDSPPSLDDHEVTDKGSINQRAVMAARAHLIENIYADQPVDHVLVTNRQTKA